jgi:hypothetical protein
VSKDVFYLAAREICRLATRAEHARRVKEYGNDAKLTGIPHGLSELLRESFAHTLRSYVSEQQAAEILEAAETSRLKIPLAPGSGRGCA